ncbi:MAG TPA: peptidase S10 [Blastocatellia bacterium]|nr:peptidase S10 [Blastocatellia bacterium]HMZ16949.1 peptidase S10 [Blastocatellia bacterium]HNG34441.1 peptidase S10 [Blastocatellia bacterium]
MFKSFLCSLVLLLTFNSALAQQRPPQAPTAPTASPAAAPTPPPVPEAPPVVTKHELKLGDKTLKYTVTTGLMPIKNTQTGDTEAQMFFLAYTLDGTSDPAKRPLMFSFNGGPGSSSVWLHLGALGPKRVKMQDDGWLPAAPYELVPNEHTWLDQTDLVFIDPVGTGYSRATRPELAAKFLGLNGDLDSVGEFIRLYLTRNERWASPLFLVGESYGTTRASGLSGLLVDRGIAFNGVLLISTVMNFQTLLFANGNDTPFVLMLPSYAATAWYHKKLPADLQRQPLRKVLDEAERWAINEYAVALAKSARMTAAERQKAVEHLARYTGLSKQFIEDCDLRVDLPKFNKELLRSERRTTGRLDSRFKGIDSNAAGERPDFDPSMSAIRPPYTAAFNDYVRRELGYKSDAVYHILGGGFTSPWNWGSDNSYVDTSVALKSAFAKNPFMKLFVAYGYYDMATPYFAAEYTMDHLNLDASLRPNIKTAYYEAGHMMYIDMKSLARLKQDVTAFVQDALKK